MKIQYYSIPSFNEVYLEDSFVLSIVKSNDSVEILVEAVLREHHPKYNSPKPGEQYCYKKGRLLFKGITQHSWLEKIMKPIKDIDGEVDYGNIDWFYLEDGHYRIGGEWGELDIISDEPIFSLIEE